MVFTVETSLPPFQTAAVATGIFSPAEMDGLIARSRPSIAEAQINAGVSDPAIRRSQTLLVKPAAENRWLFERLWNAATEMNRRFFCVDINAVSTVQVARYAATDQGFFDWHTDFGDLTPNRKISITVQLSDPADYDGGDLELSNRTEPYRAERARGAVVAFPSWVRHRVTPVTRGERWSLVAWISGPRWR